nr:RNA-directed DNA polymerase, eukaryota, reverse transcriptase zinc-binding domain protein [Tanacetum cinerariifolium]
MKMEIQLEPTSNKLMINLTKAGNPVKKILLKLNLSDHRKLKDRGEDILEVALKSLNSRSSLSLLLYSVVLSSSSDYWSWTLHGHGEFSVKSDREEMDKHLLVTSSSSMRWS